MADKLTREELKEWMDAGKEFILVDVLDNEQYEKEHIPGAVSLPLGEIDDKAQERLSRALPVVVYCGSFECPASEKAAGKLEAMGYQPVYDYEGGIADWKEGGFSVE